MTQWYSDHRYEKSSRQSALIGWSRRFRTICSMWQTDRQTEGQTDGRTRQSYALRGDTSVTMISGFYSEHAHWPLIADEDAWMHAWLPNICPPPNCCRFSADSTQVDWLGLKADGHPALSLHSSDEPGELSPWLGSWRPHHKHCRGYCNYCYYNFFKLR